MAGLKYIGHGRFVAGVPARDLDEADLDRLAALGWGKEALLRTGLYQAPRQKRKPKQASAPKPKEPVADKEAAKASPVAAKSEDNSNE